MVARRISIKEDVPRPPRQGTSSPDHCWRKVIAIGQLAADCRQHRLISPISAGEIVGTFGPVSHGDGDFPPTYQDRITCLGAFIARSVTPGIISRRVSSDECAKITPAQQQLRAS